MFSKKVIGAFIICALLISAAFYVDAFNNWYHSWINAHDEGWIDYGKKNAQDTCEASIFIDKWGNLLFPWVNTYETASVSTAALDSWGNQNTGSCGVWIRINAQNKGRVFQGAETIDNSDSKRRFFVSPGEVTVEAWASASPMLDGGTGKVQDSF